MALSLSFLPQGPGRLCCSLFPAMVLPGIGVSEHAVNTSRRSPSYQPDFWDRGQREKNITAKCHPSPGIGIGRVGAYAHIHPPYVLTSWAAGGSNDKGSPAQQRRPEPPPEWLWALVLCKPRPPTRPQWPWLFWYLPAHTPTAKPYFLKGLLAKLVDMSEFYWTLKMAYIWRGMYTYLIKHF